MIDLDLEIKEVARTLGEFMGLECIDQLHLEEL